MSITKKQNVEGGTNRAILSSSVRSYGNDPFFVKKANEAADALKEIVLPKDKSK